MPEEKEEPKMTLEEFRDRLKQEADRFYEEWMAAEKHPKMKAYYDHAMTEDQWWEQHTAWSGMGSLGDD